MNNLGISSRSLCDWTQLGRSDRALLLRHIAKS